METESDQTQHTHQGIDTSQNPISPYYLHPGENPGAILVAPPLNGTNYHIWSRAMRRALSSKNKFKSLSQTIAQGIVYIENAQELWEDLNDRFSKADHFRTFDLLQELHSIKQVDRDVTTYFNDIKILWEDLDSLRPALVCYCANTCNCGLIKNVRQDRDSEYVICVLRGLNDQYNTIKIKILLMEPLPPINKVFSLVLQQERQ
ncbi:hypothetical protein Lal_00031819 [Lupinus albus]|nr:hypothetical protein Lal_00031819 [Lupinus albus]